MSKLDKVLEAAAPVAKETAMITGKGLGLAGKEIKRAGTKVINSYKDKREDIVHERITELKEIYPDCMIFVAYEVSLFNMDKLNSMGANVSASDFDKNIIIIFNELNSVQYRIIETYDSIFRRSSLFNNIGERIGNIKPHGRLLSKEYESIYHRGSYTYDLDNKYHNGFNTPELTLQWVGGGIFDTDYKVYHNGLITMEKIKMKGRNLIVVADPLYLENSLLIYTAIHLRNHPRPETGGGGE